MPDRTVTLDEREWQVLTSIIANATGYMAFQRMVSQLQAQEAKGNGMDPEPFVAQPRPHAPP